MAGGGGGWPGQGALVLSAAQLLTRLPLPDPGWEEGRLRRAMAYFPLVGALVGAAGAVVWLGAGLLWPSPVAAGLALAAQIALTGALHEDGLADCADALGATAPRARAPGADAPRRLDGRVDAPREFAAGAARDPGADAARERALAILRDPRIGSYGATALVLALGLRWAALAALAPAAGAVALVVAGAVGRAAILGVTRALASARGDGLAAALVPGPSAAALAVGFGTAAALAACAGVAGLAAVAAAALAAAALGRRARARLGGYTGDVLGAVAALAELAALLAIAAVWA